MRVKFLSIFLILFGFFLQPADVFEEEDNASETACVENLVAWFGSETKIRPAIKVSEPTVFSVDLFTAPAFSLQTISLESKVAINSDA